MGFKVSIKFENKALKKIARDVRKLAKTEIEWGWINGKAYNKGDINGRGGIPYALIAINNEFGGYAVNYKNSKYVYIPSRPYFRQSIPDSVTYMPANVKDAVMLMFVGGDYKTKLNAIGLAQVGIVKASVAKNNMKGLHPKTVAIKGGQRQWHDTGKMVENITHKVIYKRADYQGD